MNEVEIEDEEDEDEGERKREAKVFHGSLTMKDLQPATRWETLDLILVFVFRLLLAPLAVL